MTHRLFVLLFLLITQTALSRESFSSPQDTLQGKVVGIADGDTFTMLLDNKTTIKIRLASIDCPERKQPYSAVATKFLSDHIFGNREKVVVARVTWTLDWEQEGVGKLPPNFDMIDTWKKNENGIWQILSRVSQMLNEPYSN